MEARRTAARDDYYLHRRYHVADDRHRLQDAAVPDVANDGCDDGGDCVTVADAAGDDT